LRLCAVGSAPAAAARRAAAAVVVLAAAAHCRVACAVCW
jgi:hypothetical protein